MRPGGCSNPLQTLDERRANGSKSPPHASISPASWALEDRGPEEGRYTVSTTDQLGDHELAEFDSEARIRLDLDLQEAEALRTWLLKPAADGVTSLDDPLVSAALSKLGRALDIVQATINVRRELEQAGLDVGHLSDEQVRELGRRVSEAALPAARS